MSRFSSFDDAYAAIWERSGWDRGFISNPFAGDDAARLGLIRTEHVLAQLGHPERTIPLVHVAGSKGKGSTTCMIDSILRAGGLRGGRFTSPHLHSIRERFAINGAPIEKTIFSDVAGRVFDAAEIVEKTRPEIGSLTAWELSTVIALEWFATSGCDIAVIEVGMGGTLDATNVIVPEVSVITRLDLEHTAVLGNTIAEIAANKAGIIKRGVPTVTVDQPADGLRVIEGRALSLDSKLLIAESDWIVRGTDDDFRAQGPWWDYQNLSIRLRGAHQLENAGLAIAAVETIRKSGVVEVDGDQAIRAGLASSNLPGRFEVVTHSPGIAVVLDGAHTPTSMSSLTQTLQRYYPNRRCIAIIGMLSGRDPREVLSTIAEIADAVFVTTSGSPRSVDPSELARALGSSGVPTTGFPNVATALATATSSDDDAVIVVTGSFGVVADARVALKLEDADLT